MKIKSIKTRAFHPPQDDILPEIKKRIKKIPEKSVLVITSKIVSIWEGRSVEIKGAPDKDELIIKNSEQYLPRENNKFNKRLFTITGGLLCSSAGIDQSNGDGFYTFLPENSTLSAKKIWKWLREEYSVKDVGVIIIDSSPIPLRSGTVGRSLGHWGFKALHDYRGEEDIFGRKIKFTRQNIPDSLSAAAGLAMGEAGEQSPLALITDIPGIEFESKPSVPRRKYTTYELSLHDDAFAPFWNAVKWKKGGKK